MKTRYLAAGFAVAGIFALLVTVSMNLAFGSASAATDTGKQLLALSAVVIDVAGLVLFGLAAGKLLADRNWLGAGLCVMIMLAAAGFSMMSIISFVASEQKGLEFARKTQEKRAADAEKAQRDAQKEVRDNQAKMAEQHMKWLQGTVKEADGRRERKDMLEAAKKVLTEVGQQQMASVPKAEVPKEEVKARPDSGTEILSNVTGIDYSTVQFTRMLYLGALLLAIKSFSFPLCSYFWAVSGTPRKRDIIDAEVIEPPKAPDPLPTELLAAKPTTKALPPPEKPRGEASGDARVLLDAIRFPRTRMKGVLAPKEPARQSALRFLTWMHCHGLTGEHTAEEFDKLYGNFCTAAHIEETALRIVKPELESLRQFIIKGAPIAGKKPTTWTVRTQPLDKLRALLLKEKIIVSEPEPKPPGKKPQEVGESTVVPFSNASAAAPDKAAAEGAPVARGPVQGLAHLQRFVPDMAGMQALARSQKAAWQQRMASRDKKQGNRMRMSRSA
jgi:hypothetical protein